MRSSLFHPSHLISSPSSSTSLIWTTHSPPLSQVYLSNIPSGKLCTNTILIESAQDPVSGSRKDQASLHSRFLIVKSDVTTDNFCDKGVTRGDFIAPAPIMATNKERVSPIDPSAHATNMTSDQTLPNIPQGPADCTNPTFDLSSDITVNGFKDPQSCKSVAEESEEVGSNGLHSRSKLQYASSAAIEVVSADPSEADQAKSSGTERPGSKSPSPCCATVADTVRPAIKKPTRTGDDGSRTRIVTCTECRIAKPRFEYRKQASAKAFGQTNNTTNSGDVHKWQIFSEQEEKASHFFGSYLIMLVQHSLYYSQLIIVRCPRCGAELCHHCGTPSKQCDCCKIPRQQATQTISLATADPHPESIFPENNPAKYFKARFIGTLAVIYDLLTLSPRSESTQENPLEGAPFSSPRTGCQHSDFDYENRNHYDHPGHCQICDYQGKIDASHHYIYHCRGSRCGFELCDDYHAENEEGKGGLVKRWMDSPVVIGMFMKAKSRFQNRSKKRKRV